jgi:hypothetical protein
MVCSSAGHPSGDFAALPIQATTASTSKGLLMYHAMTMEMVNESDTVAVRFSIDNRSSLLSVGDIDTLIDQLIRLRADMEPAHPAKPLAAHDYPLQVDPCWQVEWSPMFDGPVLLLRHAGTGWIAYMLPPASVERLIEVLRAKQPTLTPPSDMLVN